MCGSPAKDESDHAVVSDLRHGGLVLQHEFDYGDPWTLQLIYHQQVDVDAHQHQLKNLWAEHYCQFMKI